MDTEQLEYHLRQLAHSKCETKHSHLYDSLVCVDGNKGFKPPCDSCMAETREEYQIKLGKARGREISSDESKELRKRLGID